MVNTFSYKHCKDRIVKNTYVSRLEKVVSAVKYFEGSCHCFDFSKHYRISDLRVSRIAKYL